jgi:uncharacterized protein (TIGR02453 family)
MKTVIDFISELDKNNNRDWFNANKNKYLEAKSEFETMVNQLIAKVHKFDPEIGTLAAKDCVFRIYRDVRFSKDKSPYKTNMGGFIAKGGRKGMSAGYYLHIDTNQAFIAGGMYMPPADLLKKIRMEIMYNIDEFKSIISKPSFTKTFGQIEGEKLKRPPKDFPLDFPDIELLKYKSYTVMHAVSTEQILDPDFENYTVKVFKEMFAMNRFLNKALE